MAAESLPVRLPIGVVLLSDGHTPPEPERLAAFDRRLQGWLAAFASATRGRMVLDAELAFAGREPLGGACEGPEDCDRRFADRCAASIGDAPLTCTRGCTAHDGCGPGFCCVGTWAPGLCVAQAACGAPPASRQDAGPEVELPASNEDTTSPLPPKGSSCTCATSLSSTVPSGWMFGMAAAAMVRRRRRADLSQS